MVLWFVIGFACYGLLDMMADIGGFMSGEYVDQCQPFPTDSEIITATCRTDQVVSIKFKTGSGITHSVNPN